MQANYDFPVISRDIWLDWLSQPTDPVYKSLLSQVIRIKDPSSKKSLLEWSGNTDSTKAHDIKAWIKKVLPDEAFENLPKESEIAASMTSVPHHPINPRKRRRNRHQIGLRDEQKKHQKKSMLPVTLPAFLPDLADTETNSQEIKPAQTLTISSSHRQDRFQCDFTGCDKHYKLKSSLTRHKKIHTNPEKFRCDVPGCGKKSLYKMNLKRHRMKVHNISDFLPTLPISAPASIVAPTSAEIKIPSTPAIVPVITQTESPCLIERAPATAHPGKDSSPPLQSPPHEAKALPITLNDPLSETGMGTRQFPPYSLRQWQQNLIKVRQLPDGKIMTAAQNCTKVVDKLIEGSYSGVFTQADPAPVSGLEYSSDIKIIDLNNNKYAALDGSTLTLTEQGINKYMQIPVVKKEGSVPCFNANFEEDKFKGTYIEVKQLKPTMQTLARQYGGWVLAVAALSPLVKLTRKKRTATLSDFKNYGHVCLIQYDGASFIIIDPQLTRQEDINKCVESDINNVYRFFNPKSPAKSAEFNDHITLTVVNSSVDMRRKSKTESLSDGGSTQASASTSLGSPL